MEPGMRASKVVDVDTAAAPLRLGRVDQVAASDALLMAAMRLTDWLALERFSSDITSEDADRALAQFIKR